MLAHYLLIVSAAIAILTLPPPEASGSIITAEGCNPVQLDGVTRAEAILKTWDITAPVTSPASRRRRNPNTP